MYRAVTMATVMALSVGLAACETKQERVANKEDNLAAAGFKFVPANTPARQASFKTLPPYKFSRQIRNGQVFYVYADPTVCVCVYVGDQTAYGTYRKNMFQKQVADEQLMAAQTMEMYDWDWGPWGGWPYGWYY